MKKLGKVGRELELLPDARQRADHKGREIAKALRKQRHAMEKFDIEVVDVNPIPQGVEVFARVFNKDGSQVGFGPDGSVDIERFRFINPPILVPDGTVSTGTITNAFGETLTAEIANFVEDVEAALLKSLDHTISVTVRHGEKRIVPGKVGSTVTTTYPVGGTTSPCDGFSLTAGQPSWAAARNAGAGISSLATDSQTEFVGANLASYVILRGFFNFDTSSIPDTDVISSAVFSVAGTGGTTANADSSDFDLVAATPASTSNVVDEDFDQVGSTVFGSLALASYVNTNNVYNDVTLNANGIAHISLTGITKFGTRNSRDTDNAEPTGTNQIRCYMADQTGTSSDPKLVVTHAPSGPAASRRSIINA